MSGYTPVFDTVFQGTLCGKYPDLPVWLVLLALQQRGGIIDAHPSYIATISGLPQADIEAAIKRFCEPDPASRTADFDGRRLEPIEGAGFGWRVLNHRKYQEKARKQAFDSQRVADGRNAERMTERRETRADPTRPAQTRADPPSYSDSNSNSNKEKTRTPATRGARNCPDSFVITDEMRTWAATECPGIDLDRETATFKDYTFASAKTDWLKTWRNWMRKAKPINGTRQLTKYEQSMKALDGWSTHESGTDQAPLAIAGPNLRTKVG
jgi:hypothetical protein